MKRFQLYRRTNRALGIWVGFRNGAIAMEAQLWTWHLFWLIKK